MAEPVGQDRWMVSYADFITVLFAFLLCCSQRSIKTTLRSAKCRVPSIMDSRIWGRSPEGIVTWEQRG